MMKKIEMEDVATSIKGYLATNIELLKLEGTERASVIGSGFVVAIILGIFGFLTLFFLSLGSCFYISSLIGDNYSGFGIMAGFYLLITLILLVRRKKLIASLRDKIISKVLSA
jgi:hypothetical protein